MLSLSPFTRFAQLPVAAYDKGLVRWDHLQPIHLDGKESSRSSTQMRCVTNHSPTQC